MVWSSVLSNCPKASGGLWCQRAKCQSALQLVGLLVFVKVALKKAFNFSHVATLQQHYQINQNSELCTTHQISLLTSQTDPVSLTVINNRLFSLWLMPPKSNSLGLKKNPLLETLWIHVYIQTTLLTQRTFSIFVWLWAICLIWAILSNWFKFTAGICVKFRNYFRKTFTIFMLHHVLGTHIAYSNSTVNFQIIFSHFSPIPFLS